VSASGSWRVVPNLKQKDVFPPRPTRFCLYRIGPGESSLSAKMTNGIMVETMRSSRVDVTIENTRRKTINPLLKRKPSAKISQLGESCSTSILPDILWIQDV